MADGVPGDVRLLQAQFGAQRGLGLHGDGLERRQRACSPCKFAHQQTRLQLLQPLLMALHSAQDAGHLVAEGHGNGLLQVAAADHGRQALLFRLPGQRVGQAREVGFHQRQRLANLQHGGGVGDD